MRQKTKTISGLIIAVILIIFFGFVFLLSRSKKGEFFIAEETNIEEAQDLIESVETEQDQVYRTFMINGEIVSILNDKIELLEGETKSEYVLNKNVAVIETKGEKVEKKDFNYLKEGQMVSLVINQSDSEIILIKVVIGNSDPKAIF
ncbi:MAG: hypothetical protein UT48_C0014G0023 [Parcubacteria group bacterium GW2011_GWE2_39_37]|uniref:DUF5666 domain-containing protein n=1 Tax=Candidatus Falkowbacteria bacterium GW2011_GWF2_39_8 TaxID=1618642 RepID=A0A0G0T073_9BACT|nr:MAG: hypothetical protein UT48_C0014G0023 [Parcubacteria group bacterium GW2011_GWE2_39_37]KKR31212.1 MAG: hypothetical protein UT64_C0069G0011 [Candidatus Falkowbacteria bacterium GW2011_GWF2_39_8]